MSELIGQNPCCRIGWQQDECERDGDGVFLCPVCLEMLREEGQIKAAYKE